MTSTGRFEQAVDRQTLAVAWPWHIMLRAGACGVTMGMVETCVRMA